MSSTIQAVQSEVSGSHVVHLSFALISLTMALFSLYLDLRFFFGWNNGAWLFKVTHWSLIVTITFLAVSVADAMTLGWMLAGPRRWLMYTALVLAMAVDVNYFLVLVPQRLLRMRGAHRRKPTAGNQLTPVSTHKHLLNLTWILGDAGTYVLPRNPELRHKPLELLVCGVLVPMIVFGSYLTLAYAIKSRKQGPKVLRAMGMAAPEDEARRMSVRRRSARRRNEELMDTAKVAAAAAAAAESDEHLRAKQLGAPSALTVASLAVANGAQDAARRPSALRRGSDGTGAQSIASAQQRAIKRSSVKRQSVKRGSGAGGTSEAGSWEFDDDVDFDDEYDDDASSVSSLTMQDDLTRRVKPGRWIYSSFQYRKLRTAFLLQPFIYGPVAWGSLEMAEGLLVGHAPLQMAALVVVTVVTPLLYGPELWERSKATLFQALVQVRRDFMTLSAYLSRVVGEFLARHKQFFRELQERMEERARKRRERMKRLIPKIKNAVATTVDAVGFVLKETGLYLWRNMSDVGGAVRDFAVQSIPALARYVRKVVRGLARMAWRDLVDGIAEVHEWIDSVELEEYE